MSISAHTIPQHSVEILARGTYREARSYGFDRQDFIRFVNSLLVLSMHEPDSNTHQAAASHALPLSARGSNKEAPGVRIRSFDPDTDSSYLENWLDDEEGQHFLRSRMSACPIPLHQLIESDQHALGLIENNDGSPIGCMAFLDLDTVQHKAELRKLIGIPHLRNKGFGKAATRQWIRYGWDVLGLQKVYSNTLISNLRNIRINEQLGFSLEGILRNELFLDGAYHDIVRMALYKSPPTSS